MTLDQILSVLNLRYEIIKSGRLEIFFGVKLLFVGLEHEAWRWLAIELAKGYKVSGVKYWLPNTQTNL